MGFHKVTLQKLLVNFIAEDASYLWKWKWKIQVGAKLAAKLQLTMLGGNKYNTTKSKAYNSDQ